MEKYNQSDISLPDIGFDHEGIQWKLVGNAFILAVTLAFNKVLKDPTCHQIHLRYKQKSKKELYLMSFDSFSYNFYSAKTYVKILIFDNIPKILLLTIFILSLQQKSCIGFIYLAFLIIILIVEKENRWSAAWIPLTFFAICVLMVQYILRLEVFQSFLHDVVLWAGSPIFLVPLLSYY